MFLRNQRQKYFGEAEHPRKDKFIFQLVKLLYSDKYKYQVDC